MQALKFRSDNNILIPILFILNMLEIIFTVKRFTPLYEISPFTYTTFSIAIVIISIIVIFLYRASEKVHFGEYLNRFNIGLLHFMLVNTMLTYIGGFLYFKRYVPGMITGIFIIIPCAIYIFRKVKKLKMLNNQMINASLVVAISLIILTVLVFYLASMLDSALYPVVVE